MLQLPSPRARRPRKDLIYLEGCAQPRHRALGRILQPGKKDMLVANQSNQSRGKIEPKSSNEIQKWSPNRSKILENLSWEAPGSSTGGAWGPKGGPVRNRREKGTFSPPLPGPILRHFRYISEKKLLFFKFVFVPSPELHFIDFGSN